MKYYIAGKITDNKDYKKQFTDAETMLLNRGNKVMNPARLNHGFAQSEYMKICFAMINVCEAMYFLDNWEDSVGAKMEHDYGIANNKRIVYQNDQENEELELIELLEKECREVDKLDINIKYKEINKVDATTKLISEELRYYLKGDVFDYKAVAEEIDAIYKDDCKQIDSIKISGKTLKILWRMLKRDCERAESADANIYEMYKTLKPYRNQLERA